MEVTIAALTPTADDPRQAVVSMDVLPRLFPIDDGRGRYLTLNGKRCLTTLVGATSDHALHRKTIALSAEVMERVQVSIADKVVLRAADLRECESITLRRVTDGDLVTAFENGFVVTAINTVQRVAGETEAVGEILGDFAATLDNQIKVAISELCKSNPQGYPVHVYDVIKQSGLELYVAKIGNGRAKYGLLTDMTELIPSRPIDAKKIEMRLKAIGLEDIGGLEEAVQQIRLMAELPLLHPEIFNAVAAPVPRGILLFGPPGSGKTNLARALANETDIFMLVINGPECMGALAGESEKKLRSAFEECRKHRPALLFLDEIDAIAPKRDKTQGELEKRIVAQLLTLMDGITSNDGVLVIGATNRPNAIDPALRRFGRFDKEIHIGVPDEKGRLEILKKHVDKMPLDESVNLEKIATDCHGFVGADLAALAAEASLHCIQSFCTENPDKPRKINFHEPIPREQLNEIKVCQSDFEAALSKASPSAMREAMIEKPSVKWSDIGGLGHIKDELREMIELPVKYPKLFADLKMQPSRGVLFYGPSGCGKTLMAKAVANESKANFISVKGPELLTMWFGESEANIRELFARARAAAPCIIFFDEIDSIAPARGQGDSSGVTDRVINQILTEMDGMDSKKNVFVIGATNRPDAMDTALLRPGRLDQLVYITLPDAESRLQIFKHHLEHCTEADLKFDLLVERTSGYSGADIAEICQRAGKHAIRERTKIRREDELQPEEKIVIMKKHIEQAMCTSRKSVKDGDLRAFEMFAGAQKSESAEDKGDFRFPPEESIAKKVEESEEETEDEYN